ncbi:phage head-binding domain-containing protein [Xenorhabdus bovienii]|uniref:phage head-binding domain-containing protein n=1 Tax=Xenorhabdus bovienii TaxID=40576 RepID=UPI0023B22AD1|nr:phage head-binding domain-containing protein [Xenorhabdus bovienii]
MSEIIPNVVVSMPSQLFTMARSFKAASNGRIYIGKIDTDPTIPENQIQVYMERENGDLIPASQPIIINAAGYPVYAGQIAKFVTIQGHSMAVYDSYGVQQHYYPNILKYDPDQLRQELEGENGYKIIPSVFKQVQIQHWRDIGDIRGWGAIEGEDCTAALQAAINERAAKAWTTSADIIINGSYRIDGQVILTTDVRLKGNWATITSDSDDFLFISGYKTEQGDIINNFDGLTDSEAIAKARLKGTTVSGVTFVNCSKVFRLRCFNELSGLSDLIFENCGLCWDILQGFYSFYNNIVIRGSKSGYSDEYAYVLRRASNLINLYKVTISNRVFGEYIGDDSIPEDPLQDIYSMIYHDSCSYEQCKYPSTIAMRGQGYVQDNYYLEHVNTFIRIIEGNEHLDFILKKPGWVFSVDRLCDISNVKGQSEIYQPGDYSINPPLPCFIRMDNCNINIIPHNNLGDYKTIDNANYRIEQRNSRAFITGVTTISGMPISINLMNSFAPVHLSGKHPFSYETLAGAKKISYDDINNKFIINTDFIYDGANLISLYINWYKKSDPTKRYIVKSIILVGSVLKIYGQDIIESNTGIYTDIIIPNADPTGDGFIKNGDYVIEGLIRLV